LQVPPEELWTEIFLLCGDCSGNANDIANHLEGRTSAFSLEAQRVHALADRCKRLEEAVKSTDLKAAKEQIGA
jgi:hypothetical protein